MSQSVVWSMGTITFEGKIPVSDREDTYLGGRGGDRWFTKNLT